MDERLARVAETARVLESFSSPGNQESPLYVLVEGGIPAFGALLDVGFLTRSSSSHLWALKMRLQTWSSVLQQLFFSLFVVGRLPLLDQGERVRTDLLGFEALTIFRSWPEATEWSPTKAGGPACRDRRPF